MVLGARLESSLVHSCGVPPIVLKRLSVTKYLRMLHLPCHITWALHASTPIKRRITPCLQPQHHRYLQLLPQPQHTVPAHRRCVKSTPPAPGACCSLSPPPPPSHPDTDTNLTCILTVSLQPARPGRRTQTTHTHSLYSTIPRGLCIVLVYPSRPFHYERQKKRQEKGQLRH